MTEGEAEIGKMSITNGIVGAGQAWKRHWVGGLARLSHATTGGTTSSARLIRDDSHDLFTATTFADFTRQHHKQV